MRVYVCARAHACVRPTQAQRRAAKRVPTFSPLLLNVAKNGGRVAVVWLKVCTFVAT